MFTRLTDPNPDPKKKNYIYTMSPNTRNKLIAFEDLVLFEYYLIPNSTHKRVNLVGKNKENQTLVFLDVQGRKYENIDPEDVRDLNQVKFQYATDASNFNSLGSKDQISG